MFLIYSQERSEPLAAEEAETVMNNHWALMQDAKQKGVLLGVDALKPTSTATTVRVTNGQALTTDGPFAETKEQLAGYYMLECKDLDDAIEQSIKPRRAGPGGPARTRGSAPLSFISFGGSAGPWSLR
jgi:hypothetical protein